MPGAWSADAQPDGCAKKPLTYWIHKRIRLLWGIFTRISAEPHTAPRMNRTALALCRCAHLMLLAGVLAFLIIIACGVATALTAGAIW